MLVVRAVMSILACSLLVLSASASLLEEATGHVVAYQFDGDSHHDAPDACDEAGAAWTLPWDGSTDGLLVPPDDASDSFLLDVPASAVGSRLSLDVEEAAGPRLAISAYAPGCLGTVFDPLNVPRPPPEPPAPAAGEEQHEASGIDDPWHCTDDGWLFFADRVGDPAPASIHVAWTDGSERTVPLTYEPGPHALYATAENTAYTLKGAWINVAAGWTGELVLVAGPCDAVDGGAVYGEPPSLEDGVLSFTPVRPGAHVVIVAFPQADQAGLAPPPCVTCPLPMPDPHSLPLPLPRGDDGHDHDASALTSGLTTVSVEGLLADPTDVPDVPRVSWPATCHFCAPQVEEAVEEIAYLLRSTSASA